MGKRNKVVKLTGKKTKYKNFDKFVNWYNTVRYHESLDTDQYLMTPNEAFWTRLPE